MANEFDTVLSTLANNPALYKRMLDAVSVEVESSRERLRTSAVSALYHASEIPMACGQGGVYEAWLDIQRRMQRHIK